MGGKFPYLVRRTHTGGSSKGSHLLLKLSQANAMDLIKNNKVLRFYDLVSSLCFAIGFSVLSAKLFSTACDFTVFAKAGIAAVVPCFTITWATFWFMQGYTSTATFFCLAAVTFLAFYESAAFTSFFSNLAVWFSLSDAKAFCASGYNSIHTFTGITSIVPGRTIFRADISACYRLGRH